MGGYRLANAERPLNNPTLEKMAEGGRWGKGWRVVAGGVCGTSGQAGQQVAVEIPTVRLVARDKGEASTRHTHSLREGGEGQRRTLPR